MSLRRALRPENINISLPRKDQPIWIDITEQIIEVDENNQDVSISGRELKILRRADLVATETVTITDPYFGQSYTLPVYLVHLAIEALALKWAAEDNPEATFDESLGRLVLNGAD